MVKRGTARRFGLHDPRPEYRAYRHWKRRWIVGLAKSGYDAGGVISASDGERIQATNDADTAYINALFQAARDRMPFSFAAYQREHEGLLTESVVALQQMYAPAFEQLARVAVELCEQCPRTEGSWP
jgi:hypothetical protein